MKNTVYGAFDANGNFIRAGRYITDSASSKKMHLKNFDKNIEIRILCETSTPLEAIFKIVYFTLELSKVTVQVKPIKTTILKDGTVVRRVKV